ncbi:hypothetical protein [Pigmentiphaga sp. D-2]|uniref:hypothetical protein n=1 Tax=Pigmentiphaga sp. D-2 TaxID=1002116 RepID=UPI00104E0855|nr:hypothetical protein [Pigmentiphaga sp. D-2]
MNAMLVATALSFGLVQPVHAHGDWQPQYGGVMNDDDEMSFEMVATPTGTRIYVSDHGEPVDVSGGAPVLTIVRQGQTLPALRGEALNKDRIDFRKISFAPGDIANIRILMPNGAIFVGRFVLKEGLPPPRAR